MQIQVFNCRRGLDGVSINQSLLLGLWIIKIQHRRDCFWRSHFEFNQPVCHVAIYKVYLIANFLCLSYGYNMVYLIANFLCLSYGYNKVYLIANFLCLSYGYNKVYLIANFLCECHGQTECRNTLTHGDEDV